jgi:hypothetical protein
MSERTHISNQYFDVYIVLLDDEEGVKLKFNKFCEEIRQNETFDFFDSDTELSVKSRGQPELTSDTIYICGSEVKYDFLQTIYEGEDDQDDYEYYYKMVIKTLKNYAAFLKENAPVLGKENYFD